MWKCPVCKEQQFNDSNRLCRSCGFDESRDFEHHPTFALLSEKLYPVSVLRKIQEERQNDLLHCPMCKGKMFLFHQKESTFLCANCGTAIRDIVFSKNHSMPDMVCSQRTQSKTAGHRIGADNYSTVYVHTDGTVRTAGWIRQQYYDDTRTWRDIVDVSSSYYHTAGLRRDGTVIATGSNNCGECNVGDWKNVIAIDLGLERTIGVRSDGTVLVAGRHAYDDDTKSWRNIIAVAAGSTFIMGLHRDGSVVSTNTWWNDELVRWKNIIAVSGNYLTAIGLGGNGTVVAVGPNEYGQSDVKDWKNIIAVSTGGRHTVGLCADGTVVAAGDNGEGQCNVAHWKDIIEVAAGFQHTVGLRRDGTLVAVGSNINGECNVSSLTNERLIASLAAQ